MTDTPESKLTEKDILERANTLNKVSAELLWKENRRLKEDLIGEQAISRLRYMEIEKLKEQLSSIKIEQTNKFARAERVIDWMNDSQRKPANTAFTEGPERQIGYAFERQLSSRDQLLDEMARIFNLMQARDLEPIKDVLAKYEELKK